MTLASMARGGTNLTINDKSEEPSSTGSTVNGSMIETEIKAGASTQGIETATADLYEPDNLPANASPISHGETQSHTIHVNGDVDWMSVNVQAGIVLTVQTSNLSGTNADTVLELYNSSCNMLTSDDDGGEGLASRIQWITLYSGLHYIKARTYGGSYTQCNDQGGGGADCSYEITATIPTGTMFTYQGRLIDSNKSADGQYDFQFKLYDSLLTGMQSGNTIDINNLDVIDGYFTTELDFGSDVFNGDARWLEIDARPNGGGFTTLSPRQEITPVPYSLQTRGIFVDNAGNVGIGTKNPQARLSLGAEIPPTLKKLAVWDGIDDFYGLGADWGKITVYANNEVKMTVTDTGYVGIGTTSPSYKLDVAGPVNLNKGTTGTAMRVNGLEALWSNGNYFSWGSGGNANYFADNVGIGTTTPQEKLHVSGGRARFDLGAGQINMSTPGGWPGIIAYAPNGHRRDITYDDSGMSISVSSTASPPATGNGIRIFEDGKVAVKILQITGGSDMAEPFDVKEADAVKAGMVLSIDPENPGKLKISQKAYDRCVAGIISGAGGVEPGMLMTQSGSAADGEYPVALTGRVYCFADASYGKIQPGDLLTTSDTPGYAMKVADYNRAQGAVLGKAMTKLDEGRGMVLVLVTLQ